jgi:acyl-CoA synthetase (AMP-forming)/AMP-acid ligase II
MSSDRDPDNPLSTLLAAMPAPRARLNDYLIEHARTRGAAEAAVENGRRLTYVALANEVARHARALQHLGIARGDRVAMMAPPSIDFLVSFLATTALGAIWVGLNPKHTRAELGYFLADATPRLLLARSRVAGRDLLGDLRALADERTRLVLLDARADAEDAADWASLVAGLDGQGAVVSQPQASTPQSLPQDRDDADAALLIYTSGTTGRPKGALLSQRALIRGALVRACVWPVAPLRSLNNLPINHIGAVGDICCTTLVAGGCQVFMEKFDPAAALRVIAEERISFWYQIPTMFQLCLDSPQAAHTDWSHLDTAVWSGGRAPRELITRLGRVARHLAVDYSMTESVGSIALTPRTRDQTLLEESVGWPDPHRAVRIVATETLEPVPPGTAGEVQIKDAWQFNGYRGIGTPPDARTHDSWFRTGDIAIRRADGTLKLVGRLNEVFKSGGYNVYPREIEQTLEAHPDVVAAAVVAVAHSLYGEVGAAFVVPRTRRICAADLDTHCRVALANYKVPKRFVFTSHLPLLSNGKIDRATLRERAASLSQ